VTPTAPGQDPGTSAPAPGPAPAGLIWTRPPEEKRERPAREAIIAAATDLADVLATLARGPDGRQRMIDIVGQLRMSKSGATQIIDRLVAAGLAARESSATDRRLVYAAITTAGRDLLAKGALVLAAIAHEHVASRLPDADLGKLTPALRTIAGASPPKASQRGGEKTEERKHGPARAP
jgi:DNA-binding MarR family transcriptional regulator